MRLLARDQFFRNAKTDVLVSEAAAAIAARAPRGAFTQKIFGGKRPDRRQ